MVKYNIVHRSNEVTLESAVNLLCESGWVPVGGPFVHMSQWFQAMVKESGEKRVNQEESAGDLDSKIR